MHVHEWGREAGLGAPFEVLEPAEILTPIVFDSPHSGARYPRHFLEASRLDAQTLRRSEDAFVDELAARCVAIGAPLLHAVFPRAYLDVNREPFELDPHMFEGRLPDFSNTRSLRVAAGLGVIPRVVGDAQPIYRGPIPVAEGLARIAALHRPYHECLTALLDRARVRYGLSILIDCHSMPSTSTDVAGCDVVLGDRFGSSAAGWIVETLEQSLRSRGLIVRRNKPYAGGYIAEHYGTPLQGRHAVQIEINRALYMDEKAIRKLEKAELLAESLLHMARALAARVEGLSETRLAAE
jgi:N-formylglutamate amidohydrolase